MFAFFSCRSMYCLWVIKKVMNFIFKINENNWNIELLLLVNVFPLLRAKLLFLNRHLERRAMILPQCRRRRRRWCFCRAYFQHQRCHVATIKWMNLIANTDGDRRRLRQHAALIVKHFLLITLCKLNKKIDVKIKMKKKK